MKCRPLNQPVERRRRRRELEAARRERARLARDLHDGLSQDLYATNLALTALRERLPSPYHGPVDDLIERQVTMFDSLRRLIEQPSRPSGAVPAQQLIAALDAIAQRELGAGLRLRATDVSPGHVAAVLVEHASFALREMLSNAVRHSGATQIGARVDVDLATITIGVDDDGVGTHRPRTPGIGLASLELRAAQCGGWFRLSGRHPRGTMARWTVPLRCSARS